MADEFDPPDNTTEDSADDSDGFFAGRRAAEDVDTSLQLQGQSRQQRAIINQQVYDATDNPNLDREQRRQAQRDLGAVQREFKFRFDWAEWRREKERRGDKTP